MDALALGQDRLDQQTKDEIPSGYRETELGTVPSDWGIDYVEEVANITTGEKNTQDRVEDGAYSFFVRSQKVERINSYSFDGEGVLTAGDGVGTGKIFHYIYGKCDIHQRVYLIYDFKKLLNGSYFYHYFAEHFYDRIMQMTAKSSVDSVRREMIARMPILLPPVKEQQAIAEALGDADGLIASLEKLISKINKIKRSLVDHYFGTNVWQNDSQGTNVALLSECAQIYQPVTISNSEMKSFGYPVYGANGQIGFYDKYNHGTWQITITCRGSTCGTVGRTVELSWITGNAMVINADEFPSVFKPYLYHYLCSVDYSNLITGTGQPQIVREPLKNLRVMLPNIESQKSIASQFDEIDDLIVKMNQKLEKVKKIKAGMMQELLTGRIRLI